MRRSTELDVGPHGRGSQWPRAWSRVAYASLLIASGLDVKVVQARLRHTAAKTTLDTYGHLWPDSDDSTRAAIAAVIAARREAPAD